MNYATISADIVDSTKLDANDTMRIKQHLTNFLKYMMSVSKGSWGRVVKGDAFECVLNLRLSDVNESEKSEYVVEGTFLSFGITLLLGLLVVHLV